MYAELEQIVCTKCKIAKDKKEFGLRSNRPIGRHSNCFACKKIARQEQRKQNPEVAKEKDFAGDLWKHYRIRPEQYWSMFDDQKGRCGICGEHRDKFQKRLHVDHDHKTGQVRGLLCTRCNPAIGYFEESVERLEMAITYLKKFKKLG